MTTAQAAAKLGTSDAYIRILIRRGRLSATKVGRDWHITDTQLRNRKQGRTPKGSK